MNIKFNLPIAILLSSLILGGFFYATQVNKQGSIEKQQQIESQAKIEIEKIKTEQIQKEISEKEKSDALINKCITDAYSELKTLQANYDWVNRDNCLNNSKLCDPDYWNKAKDEAFTTYKEEWVPQCKLGNRVFIHYEYYK